MPTTAYITIKFSIQSSVVLALGFILIHCSLCLLRVGSCFMTRIIRSWFSFPRSVIVDVIERWETLLDDWLNVWVVVYRKTNVFHQQLKRQWELNEESGEELRVPVVRQILLPACYLQRNNMTSDTSPSSLSVRQNVTSDTSPSLLSATKQHDVRHFSQLAICHAKYDVRHFSQHAICHASNNGLILLQAWHLSQ